MQSNAMKKNLKNITSSFTFLKCFFRIILQTFFFLIWSNRVVGECNVCSANTGLACVSGTQFQTCIDGTPQGAITSCPNSTVCSTVGMSGICQEPGTNTVQACQSCNICDATNTFACIGPSSFALCLGSTTVSDLVGTCEPNYVCNINYRFICGDSRKGIAATCSSYDDSTMSALALANPGAFCNLMRQDGRFPVGSDTKTTCRQYVYCFVRGGVWRGKKYRCPGSTYFDSRTRFCQKAVPARCPV